MFKKLKILLIAEESAGIQVLKALADSPHEIIAVMASESKATESSSSVWNIANKMKIPAWPAKEVKNPELARKISEYRTDVILNVHSLYIINELVLGAARFGAFNLHPGALPEYAGLNTPSWSIYHDNKAHAVTVHKIEPGIDTGEIVFEKHFPLTDKDSGLSVALKCIKEGVPLIMDVVDYLANDKKLPLKKQDLSKRKYFNSKPPQDGRIDWSKNARDIFNFVRACDYLPFSSPWGFPETSYKKQKIYISKATLTDENCIEQPGTLRIENNNIMIACLDYWLIIGKVIADDKSYKALNYFSPENILQDNQLGM